MKTNVPEGRGQSENEPRNKNVYPFDFLCVHVVCVWRWSSGLTKKAEPPPTCDVNRDSGTASANGGWLRRLVRRHRHIYRPDSPSKNNHLPNANVSPKHSIMRPIRAFVLLCL